ncbi:MAG: hypothetical protein A2W05_01175 [Candidatus Schekmanbacteria bacterium RBG_16_38_10]|uniref:Uncharacterized protein n=1 Tax=Candidatus Schekmanbacteria bacterium RBG_16_38_10 TaxID=1817879 RepID=A0A1F7RYR5_9BACT|nr:MAG: hypothetical protein A2W05_01175 [Candidatus Schekmanbacteria bacterium RBG_16_38_10]
MWFYINLEDKSGSKKFSGGIEESAHPYKVNEISITRLLKKNGFFWKEKVLIKDCFNNRDPILMGVLGKTLTIDKTRLINRKNIKRYYINVITYISKTISKFKNNI